MMNKNTIIAIALLMITLTPAYAQFCPHVKMISYKDGRYISIDEYGRTWSSQVQPYSEKVGVFWQANAWKVSHGMNNEVDRLQCIYVTNVGEEVILGAPTSGIQHITLNINENELIWDSSFGYSKDLLICLNRCEFTLHS